MAPGLQPQPAIPLTWNPFNLIPNVTLQAQHGYTTKSGISMMSAALQSLLHRNVFSTLRPVIQGSDGTAEALKLAWQAKHAKA